MTRSRTAAVVAIVMVATPTVFAGDLLSADLEGRVQGRADSVIAIPRDSGLREGGSLPVAGQRPPTNTIGILGLNREERAVAVPGVFLEPNLISIPKAGIASRATADEMAQLVSLCSHVNGWETYSLCREAKIHKDAATTPTIKGLAR